MSSERGWLWMEMAGLTVIGILLVAGSIIAAPGRGIEGFAKLLFDALERHTGKRN